MTTEKTADEKRGEEAAAGCGGCLLLIGMGVCLRLLYFNAFLIKPEHAPWWLQVLWGGVFLTLSASLVFMHNCGGRSELIAAFFVVQVVCVLVAFLDGFWWASRAGHVGSPLLFANATFSLCWTYPFVAWGFSALRESVEKNSVRVGIVCFLVIMLPFFWFVYEVAVRHGDPVKCMLAIKMDRFKNDAATSASGTVGTYGSMSVQSPTTQSHQCHSCGKWTSNSPDIGGEVLCSTCAMYYDQKNREFFEKFNAGTATTCEWCGKYAIGGKGICEQCRERIPQLIKEMDEL